MYQQKKRDETKTPWALYSAMNVATRATISTTEDDVARDVAPFDLLAAAEPVAVAELDEAVAVPPAFPAATDDDEAPAASSVMSAGMVIGALLGFEAPFPPSSIPGLAAKTRRV